jgi:ABC-type Fe3+-hydroxamate transport system substrate-binding protein
MLSLTDQIGNVVHLTKYPTRIISLVPSQTELLCDLGLNEEVAGITKFCVHPNQWFRAKTRVGGTKTVSTKKVSALNPDLIIANKEENVQAQIEELRSIAPVYVSDITTLEDALQMITDVGKLTGTQQKAEDIALTIQHRFDEFKTNNAKRSISNSELNNKPGGPSINQPTQLLTAYLIWKDPYMAAGGDTFINNMLQRCNFKNIFHDHTRYPQIEIGQLSTLNCQLLLLSSEPYPFNQKHINELQQHLPNTKILLVDGEMFSWYGSRLLHAPDYFGKMIALNHLL